MRLITAIAAGGGARRRRAAMRDFPAIEQVPGEVCELAVEPWSLVRRRSVSRAPFPTINPRMNKREASARRGSGALPGARAPMRRLRRPIRRRSEL